MGYVNENGELVTLPGYDMPPPDRGCFPGLDGRRGGGLTKTPVLPGAGGGMSDWFSDWDWGGGGGSTQGGGAKADDGGGGGDSHGPLWDILNSVTGLFGPQDNQPINDLPWMSYRGPGLA